MEGLDGLIFKEKQSRILMLMGDSRREWHLSDLAKESGSTYVHASRFVTRCESAGLIGSEMHGKVKRVFLTEKGARIVAKIAEIEGLSKADQNAPQAQQQTQPQAAQQNQ
ncbi:MAG: MarR family winged helix-turn-helix transcriptional regulator [Candidatus Marsarchaeota archaeon]|nr:MarR family winged helix-turn-helix transcriptional regulator [Candidatus Marsarchaeota archaeon]